MTAASVLPEPSSGSRVALEPECRALTRFLVGRDPTEYVVRKYVQAHEALPSLTPSGPFDDLLVRLGTGPCPVRWPAAAFARIHAPRSALQNKLVTLLAILETSPEVSSEIDRVPSRWVPGLLLLLGVRGMLALLALITGTLFLLPLRWILSRSPRSG